MGKRAFFGWRGGGGAPGRGRRMGGGAPAGGTTAGEVIMLAAVTPMLLSGDSSMPIGGEVGVPLGVPAAGEPPVVVMVAVAVVEAGLMESPLLSSSERM